MHIEQQTAIQSIPGQHMVMELVPPAASLLMKVPYLQNVMGTAILAMKPVRRDPVLQSFPVKAFAYIQYINRFVVVCIHR